MYSTWGEDNVTDTLWGRNVVIEYFEKENPLPNLLDT